MCRPAGVCSGNLAFAGRTWCGSFQRHPNVHRPGSECPGAGLHRTLHCLYALRGAKLDPAGQLLSNALGNQLRICFGFDLEDVQLTCLPVSFSSSPRMRSASHRDGR